MPVCPILYDQRMVIVEMGVMHAQRLKDMLVSELTQRSAADSCDYNRQQKIATVAVFHAFAGRESERLLTQEIKSLTL
jgi:hypothetical protein